MASLLLQSIINVINKEGVTYNISPRLINTTVKQFDTVCLNDIHR